MKLFLVDQFGRDIADVDWDCKTANIFFNPAKRSGTVARIEKAGKYGAFSREVIMWCDPHFVFGCSSGPGDTFNIRNADAFVAMLQKTKKGPNAGALRPSSTGRRRNTGGSR